MLADKLPDRIGGRPVDTGFRKWLRIAKLLQAPLLPEEMQAILFYNLFGGIPAQEGAEKLMDEVLRFYLCGKSPAPSVGLPKEQLLDWEKDADAIWADFMIYARMDLNKADLHWWEFMALFGSLPKEAAICRRMDTRAIDLSKIKDPQLKEEYRKKKAAVSLRAVEKIGRMEKLE